MSGSSGIPDASVRVVDDEAKRLASLYKLAIADLRTCLNRVLDSLAPDLWREPTVLAHALAEPPFSLLSDALDALSPERAIQIVCTEDLQLLVSRMRAAEYLVQEHVPFYSFAELEEHSREFVDFLTLHRDYLVQFGLPPRFFARCPWLYVQLGRLYDTRKSTSPYPHDQLFRNESTPSEMQDREPYQWCQTPQGRLYALSEVKRCQYSEADLLSGMQREDAERIERDRARVFQVKRNIVRQLSTASASSINPDALWETCLGELASEFNADDINFYLEMDRWYLGEGLDLGRSLTWDQEWSPGGLTNLFEVIGRFEAELRIGTFDKAYNADNSLLFVTLSRLSEEGTQGSSLYFGLVDHPSKNRIDGVLDEFTSRVRREMPFWAGFRERLESSLHSAFRVNVSVELLPKHAELLGPLLQMHASHMVERIERDDLNLTPPDDAAVFRKDGDYWTIAYKGKTIARRDLVGLWYIAVLLSNPGKKYSATELRKMRHRATATPSAKRDFDSEEPQFETRDLGEILDRAGMRVVRSRIEAAKKELTALSNPESEKGSELRHEIEDLTKRLKDATSRGAPRKISAPFKKDYDAVANAIQRIFGDLEKAHPFLWQHLKASLIRDAPLFFYAPDPPVEWVV